LTKSMCFSSSLDFLEFKPKYRSPAIRASPKATPTHNTPPVLASFVLVLVVVVLSKPTFQEIVFEVREVLVSLTYAEPDPATELKSVKTPETITAPFDWAETGCNPNNETVPVALRLMLHLPDASATLFTCTLPPFGFVI